MLLSVTYVSEENCLDNNVHRYAIGPVDCVSKDDLVQELKEMKP